jgi:putative membrane protein
MVPPQQLTPGETKNVGILTNLPAGSRFDRAYLDGQIRQHRETLRALTSYAQSGTDPDLKAFAAETAPIVRQHLADAQKLMHGR